MDTTDLKINRWEQTVGVVKLPTPRTISETHSTSRLHLSNPDEFSPMGEAIGECEIALWRCKVEYIEMYMHAEHHQLTDHMPTHQLFCCFYNTANRAVDFLVETRKLADQLQYLDDLHDKNQDWLASSPIVHRIGKYYFTFISVVRQT